MFWIARLPSDTPNGLSLSVNTPIANDASPMYEPDRMIPP